MRIPACLLILFLAFAIGACSSESDEVSDHDASQETDGSNEERDEVGLWTISEDDNRTRLSSCNLRVQVEGNSTGLVVVWSKPENAPSPPFYRVEIAEDIDFDEGYRSFSDLTATSKQITDLTPNHSYYIRLQAYLVNQVETENNASGTSPITPFAPSEPEVVATDTAPNRLSEPGNLEVLVDYGKFSAQWGPPLNAIGKLEYVVSLHMDETLKTTLDHRLVKEPMIKEWIVEPENDYWLAVRALPDPDSTNKFDSDSERLVKHFHVPSNKLDSPENLKVSIREDAVLLSWDPINNNQQYFEYQLLVYLDENKSEQFGKYQTLVPMESISDLNQNLRYWVDLQAVPVSGNHADSASEIVSSFIELPAITYATPIISEFLI